MTHLSEISGLEKVGETQTVESILDGIYARITERTSVLENRKSIRYSIIEDLKSRQTLLIQSEETKNIIAQKIQYLESLKIAQNRADKCIRNVRTLVQRVRNTRTRIVLTVFNQALNSVWNDLFVRLAPEEPFVPTFALPEVKKGPVEAVLKTLYRPGGKGGNPRAVLSGGNLNTAALTLFLALHLSVKPALPWLVIDDPVRSMDEVHITQFAALLRTLSKQHGRQIVVAIHDKFLFDYLALELNPSFPTDRLIVVKIDQKASGLSVAEYELITWQEDPAIAA